MFLIRLKKVNELKKLTKLNELKELTGLKKLKKLKKLTDIPAWFDISKYDNASSFGLDEWYEQIRKRRIIFDRIFFTYMHDKPIDNIETWEHCIKFNPILEGNGSLRVPPGYSVRDFSAGDLGWINAELNMRSDDDELRRFCNDIENISMSKKYSKYFNTSISPMSKHEVFLTANLGASDEQLISDFKSWLKQARTKFIYSAPEELFTHCDFKDWCKYAILPYLDLAIWAFLNGAEFTTSIMSEAIFPS